MFKTIIQQEIELEEKLNRLFSVTDEGREALENEIYQVAIALPLNIPAVIDLYIRNIIKYGENGEWRKEFKEMINEYHE